MPVELFERPLAEVVEAGLLEQRGAHPPGVVAGHRLGVVVEVDQECFVVAALDEAVGVTVEGWLRLLAGEPCHHGGRQDVAFEVGDGSRLGGRQVGGVADHEHVRVALGLEGGGVGRDEGESVAEAGGAANVGGASVHRHDHGQVEADLPPVEGPESAGSAVDLAGAEVGDHVDVLPGEDAGELPVADLAGEPHRAAWRSRGRPGPSYGGDGSTSRQGRRTRSAPRGT